MYRYIMRDSIIDLLGGGRTGICTRNGRYLVGCEFTRVGLWPHLPRRPTVAETCTGRDTVLDAALAEEGRESLPLRTMSLP